MLSFLMKTKTENRKLNSVQLNSENTVCYVVKEIYVICYIKKLHFFKNINATINKFRSFH